MAGSEANVANAIKERNEDFIMVSLLKLLREQI